MRPVISFFLLLSGLGWILSVFIHLCSFTDHSLPDRLLIGLFCALFLIGPFASIMGKASMREDVKASWHEILRGCPSWMRALPYFLMGYLFLIFYLTGSTHDSGEKASPESWRIFSAGGMVGYSFAFVILYSARRVCPSTTPRYRCSNGHIVDTYYATCPKCGSRGTQWDGYH